MADAPKLLGTDTLRQAYPKLNTAIDNSNSALTTATTAKNKADTALANSENTQTQLDTVVINGDSSLEAAQARVDTDGYSFTTLKSLLDYRGNGLNRLDDYLARGKVKFPSDFTKVLSFDLYRDFDKRIKHSLDVNTFKSSSNNVYIHRQNGLDTNSGLTESLPVRSLTKAFEIANGLSGSVANIVFLEKFITYILTSPSVNEQKFTLYKNINILSNHSGGTFIFSGQDPYVFNWTLSNGVYSTARSAVQRVIDYKFKDFLGLPKELTKKSTLAECQAEKGTWYTDGTTLYVNRFDGSIPDTEIALILPIDSNVSFNTNGYRLLIDNVHFWMKQNAQIYSALTIEGTSSSNVYLNKCSFRYSTMNGLSLLRIGNAYLLACSAADNGYDGFNYHGNGGATPYEFVFEYECYSNNNGSVVNGTGNATTAHDGLTILRVGTVGHDTYGPVLADVNGCYSLNYDCVMYNALNNAGATKAAYYFDESAALKQGKAYLFNCEGGGASTHSVNSDGNVDIYLKNFKGRRIPKTLSYTILD